MASGSITAGDADESPDSESDSVVVTAKSQSSGGSSVDPFE